MRSIRAMIVDDSLLFRELLAQELARDVNVSVVARVPDAFTAGRQIVELKPDVLIVDVIMDKLNGIEFVRQLLPQYDVPVIMVSSDAGTRAGAEALGGVTFFEKPSDAALRQSGQFFQQVLAKIRTMINKEEYDDAKAVRAGERLIAIGASTGGAEAIEQILTALPSQMPPIVISQHMPPKFTKSFAERLNAQCRLSVKEACDGETVIPGQAYIAPGGYHMYVRKRGNRYAIRCAENDTGSPVCPSVDALLQSAADAAGDCGIGALLTGIGRDGAEGLRAMRAAGGRTIGQDEDSAVVYGMPKAAFEIGAVETQLPLSRIPRRLLELSYL